LHSAYLFVAMLAAEGFEHRLAHGLRSRREMFGEDG
jgi:hypothetical protein